MSLGLLISSFDITPVAEDEFHDWYDTEHIPERERLPGFLDLRRWMSADDPKVSMTTYELASPDVLRSPGYLAVGYENNSPWTRRVGWRCIKRLRAEAVQVFPGDSLPSSEAQALVVIAANPVPGSQDALAGWVEQHVSGLAPIPGLLCTRAFVASAGTHRHVVTYHLDRIESTLSPRWQQAVVQPWQSVPLQVDLQITRCLRYRRP